MVENILATPVVVGSSEKCTDCELWRTSQVGSGLYSCNRLWGKGDKAASIMFIDSAPKEEEIKQKKPFSGLEGQLLKRHAKTVGIPDAYYTYCCKCKPEYGATINKIQITTCGKYLEQEIAEVKPKVIVALGTAVLTFFVIEGKITKLRGIPIWLSKYNCWLLPTYNPSYINNFTDNSFQAKEFAGDLSKALKISSEGYEVKKSEVSYKIASTIAEVEWMTKQLLQVDWFSADTENYHEKEFDYFRCKNLINSFSLQENNAFVIPYLHPKGFDTEQGRKEVFKCLKQIYESPVKKIFQNGKYDIQVLRTHGLMVKKFAFDTCLAHGLLDENSPHGLAKIIPIYTDMGSYKDEMSDYFSGKVPILNDRVFQVNKDCFKIVSNDDPLALEGLKKKSTRYRRTGTDIWMKLYQNEAYRKSNIFDAPYDKLTHYAAQDADGQFRLFKVFWKLLEQEGLLEHLTKIDVPLAYVLAHIEYRGIGGNKEYAKKMFDELGIKLDEAEKSVLESKEVIDFMKKHQVPNGVFNTASSDQVSKLLFEEMGLIPPKFNKLTDTQRVAGQKKGTPSVDIKSMKILLENNKIKVLEDLVKISEVAKSYEYLEGYVKILNDSFDGRIHTTYNQIKMDEGDGGGGTITGRLSSKNPNLQNIPKRDPVKSKLLRQVFTARPGYTFVAGDYKMIEFVIWGDASGDENLIQFINEGRDIHKEVAAISRKINIDQVTTLLRDLAKQTVYGLIYGRSEYSIAKEYGMEDWEVKQFVNGFFRLFPKATQFLEDNIVLMEKQGFITNIFGRKRRVLEIYSTNKFIKASGVRKIRNFPLQAGAADLVFIAMAKVYRAYVPYEEKDLAGLELQIHDELVSEIKDEMLDEIVPLKICAMENAVQLKCKTRVDVKIGKDLGNLRSWKGTLAETLK